MKKHHHHIYWVKVKFELSYYSNNNNNNSNETNNGEFKMFNSETCSTCCVFLVVLTCLPCHALLHFFHCMNCRSALHQPTSFRPRLLLCGTSGSGQTSHLAPAILHALEKFTVYTLDVAVLYGVSSATPEEACAQVNTLN